LAEALHAVFQCGAPTNRELGEPQGLGIVSKNRLFTGCFR